MHKGRFNEAPYVSSVNGHGGAVNISSPDASVTVGSGAPNDVTLETAGGGGTPYYAWAVQTADAPLVSGNGYISNSASLINYTLPAAATVGDHFKIIGYGTGGWKLKQRASQVIHYSGVNTTTGTGGSIASQSRYDTIEVVCVVADTEFVVVEAQDSLTVV